jgi:hypothetical protein
MGPDPWARARMIVQGEGVPHPLPRDQPR